MTKLPSDDEAVLARRYTLVAIEVMMEILRDPKTPPEARIAAEQALIEHGFIKLPDGPMRPCQVH